jgi:hypothetical protein
LDPSRSQLWTQGDDGKWRLEGHKGAAYLRATEAARREHAGSSPEPELSSAKPAASGSKRLREDESEDEAPSAKRKI